MMAKEYSITFLLLCFNQEKFIEDAVRSALAQKGAPIKILISDDASKDRSYELVKNLVSNYEGPHSVDLNRNSENLGLIEHLNYCMQKISTRYVVAASGDDISLPSRCNDLAEYFHRTGALLLHSDFVEIDDSGFAVRGKFPRKEIFFHKSTSALRSARKTGLYIGATGAWHRDLYEYYGSIQPNCFEDLVLGFRASLERRVCYVDKVLVKYRMSDSIDSLSRPTSEKTWHVARMGVLDRNKAVFAQRFKDAALSSHPQRQAIMKKLAYAQFVNRQRILIYKLLLSQTNGWRQLCPHIALVLLIEECLRFFVFKLRSTVQPNE